MILQAGKGYRMLKHMEIIPEDSFCYGRLKLGGIGWASGKNIAGVKWNRYSLYTPSIILVKEK